MAARLSGSRDEFQKIIDTAVAQGWKLKLTKKGHRKLLSPDGKTTVVTGGTPSDRRALMNFRADLKRAGVRFAGLGAIESGKTNWTPIIIGIVVVGGLIMASQNKTIVSKAKAVAFGAGDPTDNVIASLASRLQPIAREFVQRARAAGYQIVLASGTRTMEEQRALYDQGRTKSGKIVTNAQAGDSAHNFGLAFDFAFGNAFGRPTWPEDGPWAAVAAIGKQLGLVWGGDWKTFKDRPHLEVADWRQTRIAWKQSGSDTYAVA